MKCLILAGGFGTRLYPLTIAKAKGLLEYKGRPVISHIVDKIPEDIAIMVNTNKKFEANFHRWQRTLSREVEICVEPVQSDEEKLGAVGSLNFWVERKKITDDLLVIASDNYFGFDLARFISAYDGVNTLVAVYDIGDRDKARQFGVVRLDGNRIVELEEKPADPRSSLISTACYVFPPRIFPLLSQFCSQVGRDNLGSFITYLIGRDEVYAYVFSEPWFDIGNAETLQLLMTEPGT